LAGIPAGADAVPGPGQPGGKSHRTMQQRPAGRCFSLRGSFLMGVSIRMRMRKQLLKNQPKIPMKILVVGSGGREHALAWKLAQSERVQIVYVAPGNGGTARDSRLQNLPVTDLAALAEFVTREHIALTVVGP
jgi:FlaA1/EpsC-like NDP-sugar epimerase